MLLDVDINTGNIVDLSGLHSITNNGVTSYDSEFDPFMPIAGSALAYGGMADLYLAPSSDWALSTGPFTIEWYQKAEPSDPFPRVFSIGQYPSAVLAVSIESGTLYFWANGQIIASTTAPNSNEWVHVAIVRD